MASPPKWVCLAPNKASFILSGDQNSVIFRPKQKQSRKRSPYYQADCESVVVRRVGDRMASTKELGPLETTAGDVS